MVVSMMQWASFQKREELNKVVNGLREKDIKFSRPETEFVERFLIWTKVPRKISLETVNREA